METANLQQDLPEEGQEREEGRPEGFHQVHQGDHEKHEPFRKQVIDDPQPIPLLLY